jgi:hypothetical protein
MKVPIRSLGVLAAGLLIGSALAPVAAQQQSGVDGQVAVRSDGAVYLISNGQRRWVATVQISDDEINAYPEGDPIFVGLAPIGSTTVAASPANTSSSTSSRRGSDQNPAPAASPQAGASTASQPASQPASQTASQPASQPAGPAAPDPGASADIPIETDIDGDPKFKPGDTFSVNIKTVKDATCELAIKWPDDKEDNEDSKQADTRGRCAFNVQVPDNMKDGAGRIKGWARVGGKYNRMDVDFEVKKK